MTQYANTTTVSVTKSRGQIDALLRDWGCDGIRWTDQFATGLVRLEFIWSPGDMSYGARFSLQLPDDVEIRARARHGRTREFLPVKYEALKRTRGQSEHRILLLWLKAAFNAVEAGIVTAETLFLPFLVDANGQTIAEVALPRLSLMLSGGAEQLLGLPAPEGVIEGEIS